MHRLRSQPVKVDLFQIYALIRVKTLHKKYIDLETTLRSTKTHEVNILMGDDLNTKIGYGEEQGIGLGIRNDRGDRLF